MVPGGLHDSGSLRICQRSFGEDPVRMVYQEPEALNHTMTHCNEHLLEKMIGELCNTLLPMTQGQLFVLVWFLIFLFWGRCCRAEGKIWGTG